MRTATARDVAVSIRPGGMAAVKPPGIRAIQEQVREERARLDLGHLAHLPRSARTPPTPCRAHQRPKGGRERPPPSPPGSGAPGCLARQRVSRRGGPIGSSIGASTGPRLAESTTWRGPRSRLRFPPPRRGAPARRLHPGLRLLGTMSSDGVLSRIHHGSDRNRPRDGTATSATRRQVRRPSFSSATAGRRATSTVCCTA